MIVCECVKILQPLGTIGFADGWKGSKQMLANPKLLKAMTEYRREDASEEQFARVRELIAKENFAGEACKAYSKAAYGILEWVRAVVADTPMYTRTFSKRNSKEDAKWAWLTSEGAAQPPWKPAGN